MSPDARALVAWLQACLPTYLEELRQLCMIECPTDAKAGVDEAGAWVRRWCAARGWELRNWSDDHAGDSLVALVPGNGSLRAMLVAHLDTVYPLGTAAA